MIIGVGSSSVVSQMPLFAGVKPEELVVAIKLLMEERGSDETENCVVATGGRERAGIFLLSSTLSLPSLLGDVHAAI